MKEASEVERYDDIPWCPDNVEEEVLVNAVNGVVNVLRNNHIKRNQAKQIFDIVDMVVQDTEI